MLLDHLTPPPLDETDADTLDALYWRERQLDAVARAAQTEVAAQDAELAALRARVAEQAARLQALAEARQAAEAALASQQDTEGSR